MPATERIRTTKACVACSIRKIKCDGKDPCAHCVRFFDGECFYTTAKKRGPPKGCPARGGHKKRLANEAAAKAASQSETAQPVAFPPPQAASSQPLMSQVTLPVTNAPNTHSSLLIPPAIPGPSSAPATITDSIDDTLLTGFSFSPAGIEMTTGDHMFSSFIPLDSPSFGGRAGLTSSAIDDLLLVYETFIHVHWPVIYVPALRSLRSLETQQPLVFDAVLAISAANADTACSLGPTSPDGRFSSGTGRPLSEVCHIITESLRQRVFGSLNSTEQAASLQIVQALIMLALVDLGAGRTSLAYQMCGFACRMALDLGIHTRFSDDVRPKEGRHLQERSRTLWACFILDKMLAAVSQRPPSLRLVDIDIPRPSIMERDELDLWLSGSGSQHFLQPHARETMESIKSHTLSSFNSWCDVMSILELILSQVYRPSTRRARMEGRYVEGYEETVVHLDSELRKWRESLPPELQWSDDDENAHTNVGLHFLTCRGWYQICMLLLHRPQVPYLDTPESPQIVTTPYQVQNANPDQPYRLPNGAEASRQAATAICKIMEAYESTFRMRKFASSWVYLVFQAATVHAGLAAHTPVTTSSAQLELSPPRAESMRRLEQCIRWLDQMAKQWIGAGRHVEILRKLAAVGARTRPPSPCPEDVELTKYGTLPDPAQPPLFEQDPTLAAAMNEIPLDANAWMLLWASMPTAGDDFSLWQQCFPNV